MQLLAKKKKLVSSARGPNGGFYLTEEAKNLPVRAILASTGEENVLTKCVLGLYQCSETKPCPLHHDYKGIRQQTIQLFETKTIRTLAEETQNGKVLSINGAR